MSDILINAFELKPAQAIAYLRKKGYTISWNWFDTWQQAHVKAFTVAKVTRMDLLQDIRGMVDKALDEGITFQQFKKELTPRLKAKGWWGTTVDEKGKTVQLGSPRRLHTIYQTNMQTAYMAGRYKQQREAIASRPYWEYVAVLDSRTRPAHRALNGVVVRADDPFWNTHYPPLGFSCRCRVRTHSEQSLDREGLQVQSPDLSNREVMVGGPDASREATITGARVVGADGQPQTVWTDPGWNYNPGKVEFSPDLAKYDDDIVKAAGMKKPARGTGA